jgi:hypothetical protein
VFVTNYACHFSIHVNGHIQHRIYAKRTEVYLRKFGCAGVSVCVFSGQGTLCCYNFEPKIVNRIVNFALRADES